MSFNATSYFAGVGTVFGAVALGFALGFAITNSASKPEPPNRLERLAANAPPSVQLSGAVAKPDEAAPAAATSPAPAPPAPAPAAAAAAPETAAPQAVAAEATRAQEPPAQQPAVAAPAPAKDDAAELAKLREADLKAAEKKRAQRRKWAERQRHQQELDAATAQVRQVDREDGELVVQRAPIQTPRFGFFGNDD